MKIDLMQEVRPAQMPAHRLKPLLLGLLDSASLGNDKALPLMRLYDRLEQADGTVEVGEKESELLRSAVDATPWRAGVYQALLYCLWPEELADSDRAIIERRYAAHVGANGSSHEAADAGE